MRTAVVVCGLLLLTGCVRYETRDITETRAIEPGAAESARVQIEMGAGELRVEGGTGKLLDATFDYNIPEWKPQVKYDVTAGRGYLTVRQPEVRGLGFGGSRRYRWNLRLGDKVPMDVRVNLGAGHTVMRLSGLPVRRLNVNVGAGELDLDVSGPWEKDLDGRISGGVGQVTVRLPRDVGVRVHATGGLGSIKAHGLKMSNGYYVNDREGAGPTVRLDVSGGIGQIDLIG